MQKIDGGYVFISKKSLGDLNAQISTRKLSAIEGRGTLAFLEMQSIRRTAAAIRSRSQKRTKLIPNYNAKEFSRLTNLPLRVASKIFKKVSAVEFNPKESGKLIPVPRRVIRFLAKCQKRSTLLVLLTYLERGLSLDKGKIKSAGTAKASLISQKTGLTIRSVRTARKELLKLGLITPDTTKYQRKLNKDGAYFTINLLWNEKDSSERGTSGKVRPGIIKNPEAETVPVDNSFRPNTKISLPPSKNSSQISPPYR